MRQTKIEVNGVRYAKSQLHPCIEALILAGFTCISLEASKIYDRKKGKEATWHCEIHLNEKSWDSFRYSSPFNALIDALDRTTHVIPGYRKVLE